MIQGLSCENCGVTNDNESEAGVKVYPDGSTLCGRCATRISTKDQIEAVIDRISKELASGLSKTTEYEI